MAANKRVWQEKLAVMDVHGPGIDNIREAITAVKYLILGS
jgi:hypothetical protein